MMRRLATILAALLALGVVGIGVGFATFVAITHENYGTPPVADGIVALTGGADRVEAALHLLEAGRGKRLLVSGMAPGSGLHDIARRVDLDPALLAPVVTLGKAATTTLGNAEEATEWARAHGFHSLIIVTAGYHMPRAMLEMRRAMPDVALYPMAVQPLAMQRTSRIRLLVAEYVKLIAAWCGVSHIMRHPMAVVRGPPVDNSVNG
jgi:uncharacterized SAM-binding protein YcdF (DUF218 family)